MKTLRKFIILIFSGLLFIPINSCTKLDETLYDQVTNDNFYKTPTEFLAAIGPAYGDLRAIHGANSQSTWDVMEVTSDEMCVPTRGKHWYDGGVWQRLYLHQWTSQESALSGMWIYCYKGISTVNRLLFQLGTITTAVEGREQFVAELKIMRAFYYYMLCDLFGNVPLVDKFDVPTGFSPTNNTRKEVYDFILKEIKDNIDKLNDKNDISSYGRFNKWGALTLLAKVYLNGETWTGTAYWDDCIAACDQVIQSNKYLLEKDFFTNFKAKNEGSKENIFVIPFDAVYATTMRFHSFTLHYSSNKTYNLGAGMWNGICCIPTFYNSFDPIDKRRKGWLVGQQFALTGDSLKCSEEKRGQPLNFTVDLTTFDNAFENEGARFGKFEFEIGATASMNNDYPVFRFADILMMKAESLLRKGDAANAVVLVNQVRARAFDPVKPLSANDLTLDRLLLERGFEFYGEALRRQDQIRFGKFTKGGYSFKDPDDGDFRTIFPIPQKQIDSNPNLVQNPGY